MKKRATLLFATLYLMQSMAFGSPVESETVKTTNETASDAPIESVEVTSHDSVEKREKQEGKQINASVIDKTEEGERSFFLYKTIPNDSMWSITERHLTSMDLWPKLRKLNGLSDTDHIEPGTLLKIPRAWLKKQEAVAYLISARGDVEVIPPEGDLFKVDRTMFQDERVMLAKESRIKTYDNGLATIEFTDGSQLLLQSDSELVIKGLMTFGDGTLSEIEVELEQGRIENNIPTSIISNTNYEVTTTTGTSSVRGTNFRVSAGDKDRSITEVLEGAVNANTANIETPLELLAGDAVIMSNDPEPFKQVKLLDPPTFEQFPGLIESIPIEIAIDAKEDVVGYSTLIVPFGGNVKEPISSRLSPDDRLLGDKIPDGRYHMMVSSIDHEGVTGQPARYDFILNARPFMPVVDFPSDEQKLLASDLAFKWSDQDKEFTEGYYLQVSKEPEFKTPMINEPVLELNEFTLDERFKAGIYYWRVAAIDEAKQRGPFSDTYQFRVLLDEPLLSDNYVDTSDITLEWDELEEGTTYRVQVSDTENFNEVLIDQTVDEPLLHIEKIKPSNYFFRVQTIAHDGYVDEWGRATKILVPKRAVEK